MPAPVKITQLAVAIGNPAASFAGCVGVGPAQGSRWADVLHDRICPACRSGKRDFDMVDRP